MHQPWYVDGATGEAILPWVRLHALKDYLDIPLLAAEFPGIRQTFNWVPGLLDQIERAAKGGADPHLTVGQKPAADLTEEERGFLVREFFSISEREIGSIPAYRQLHDRARSLGGASAAADALSVDELRDLQVFFHLAWSGEVLRGDASIDALLRKKGHFDEEEKTLLFDKQRQFLGTILPRLAGMMSCNAIASATSPYHHPILPLLFEPARAAADDPSLRLPESMKPRAGDAIAQIRLGRETFERHFGFIPNGMWPPEGAVGPETAKRAGEEGILWMVTDEAILQASLPESRRWQEGDFPAKMKTLTRPYRLGGAGPAIFFRDRDLSDRIGFVYSHWDAEEAAHDFVDRIRLRAALVGGAPSVLTIALDGENAWESYDRSGRPFLRALFARLSSSTSIRVVGFEEALTSVEAEDLNELRCGSWIGGNLHTWAGDDEKNRAWTLLSRVAQDVDTVASAFPPRSLLDQTAHSPDVPDPAGARASLLAAEASDWFWWFGEGHSSAHDAEFDRLFRFHLAAARSAAGLPPLPELEQPIGKPSAIPSRRDPVAPIHPVLDGRATDYYEWLAAGRIPASGEGTMHFGSGRFRGLHFGTDGRSLFLRLDAVHPPAAGQALDSRLFVASVLPRPREWTLPFQTDDLDPGSPVAVAGQIVEARLPLSEEPLPPEARIGFRVELRDLRGRTIQRIPADGWIDFRVASEDWSV